MYKNPFWTVYLNIPAHLASWQKSYQTDNPDSTVTSVYISEGYTRDLEDRGVLCIYGYTNAHITSWHSFYLYNKFILFSFPLIMD